MIQSLQEKSGDAYQDGGESTKAHIKGKGTGKGCKGKRGPKGKKGKGDGDDKKGKSSQSQSLPLSQVDKATADLEKLLAEITGTTDWFIWARALVGVVEQDMLRGRSSQKSLSALRKLATVRKLPWSIKQSKGELLAMLAEYSLYEESAAAVDIACKQARAMDVPVDLVLKLQARSEAILAKAYLAAAFQAGTPEQIDEATERAGTMPEFTEADIREAKARGVMLPLKVELLAAIDSKSLEHINVAELEITKILVQEVSEKATLSEVRRTVTQFGMTWSITDSKVAMLREIAQLIFPAIAEARRLAVQIRNEQDLYEQQLLEEKARRAEVAFRRMVRLGRSAQHTIVT